MIIIYKDLSSQSLRITEVGGRGYARALATDVMTENACQKYGTKYITGFILKYDS